MHRLLIRALFLAALPLVALSACSDDDKATTTSAASASEDPHDKITADADVAVGLEKMVTEATASGYEEAHETWEGVEGTVKEKEPDIYAQIEEDLTLLKTSDGDAAKAKTATDSLSKSVDSYLAKHPG